MINEALRLYPPGWLLSRRTIEADVLGGFAVPAGTNVLLPLYLLHRHPQFWKRAGGASDPERFAPEHEAERPRFAYMPFAAGPRHCIGETLALYEMLMHLYKVARRYRLQLRARQAPRARGADQPAHPPPPVYATGTPVTPNVKTLIELMDANRGVDRSITYLEGENDDAPGHLRRALRARRSASCITCSTSARAAATS